MTFIELVADVAMKTGKPKTVVKEIIKEMADTIEETVFILKRDVAIPGFGKFSKRVVKGGTRRVPDFGGDSHLVTVRGRDTLKFKSYVMKKHQ